MREITVIVYEPEDIRVSDTILGYVGETGATELDVSLPSDWEGSFYIDWKVDGEWIESETAETTTDFTYTVPDKALVRGDVFMRIRVENDNKLYSELVKFMVK